MCARVWPKLPCSRTSSGAGDIARNPFFEAIFENPRSFFVAVGLKISEVSWVYILTVFVVVYGTATLGLPRQLLLNAVFIAALVEVITIPLFGWLSESWGAESLFLGHYLYRLLCVSVVLAAGHESPQIIVLAMIVALSFGHGTMFGLQSTYFPELFGTRFRYTGASFGFQLSAAIGGGLSPIVATVLLDYMGGTAGVSILLILLAVVTFVATLFAKETRDKLLNK